MDYRQQTRSMLRMYPGLRISKNENETLRFLTLTTSKNRVLRRKRVDGEWVKVERTINESFNVLRKRIQRAKLLKDGFQGFKFNRYFKVQTHEGEGVLHILWRGGRFIPVEWIRRQWEQIHGAFEVWVEMIDNTLEDTSKVAYYVVSNYLQKQKVKRISYGWRWAWLGMCRSWERTKQVYGMMRRGKGEFAVRKWNSFFNYYSSKKWAAWRCTLWEYPYTSRKIRLDRFF